MHAWHVAGVAGGVVIVGAGAWWLVMVKVGETGDPALDALRPRVALELARRGLLLPRHMRAMMAIGHNEHSSGVWNAGVHGIMDPGDLDIAAGPSVGPFQMSRRLAIWLGLWPAQPDTKLEDQLADEDDFNAYLAFGTDPANLGELVGWGVAGYAAILSGSDKIPASTRSDGSVWGERGAVRLYNGPGPTAVAYLTNAQNFAKAKWGDAEVTT